MMLAVTNTTNEEKRRSTNDTFGDTPDGFADSDVSSITYRFETSSAIFDDESVAKGSEEGRRYPRRSVIGRDVEYESLKSVWNRVTSRDDNKNRAPSEIVVIYGESGVGKSFLVDCFRPFVERSPSKGDRHSGVVVSSKFDQLAFKRGSREPFYAVVSALSDVCEILQAQSIATSDFVSQLRKALGVEFALLAQFIPTLNQLIGSSQKTCNPVFGLLWDAASNQDDSLTRVCWACTKFLREVARCTPLLLHFDDIQWADEESLALLRALVSDPDSKSIMFVVSYREGEDSATDALDDLDLLPGAAEGGFIATQKMLPTPEPSAGDKLRLTSIKLVNLNENGVHEMMSKLLQLQEQVLEPDLSNLVHAKTQGNPFFVSQFLDLLINERLLRYRSEEERWEWDDLVAMSRLDVSEDVLSSIDARVYKLPPAARTLLLVAAHLGFRVRKDVLERAVVADYSQMYRKESPEALKATFERALQVTEKASMFLRLEQGRWFCFLHDRVQQCAYDMVPEGEMRSRTYLRLGRRVAPMMKEDESLTFLVADVLNNGSDLIVGNEKRSELVLINKAAAELSMKRAAYRSASHYLSSAIDLLPRTSWSSNYELSLALHNSLALASCSAAEYEICRGTVETLLRNGRNVRDKHTAYLAHIHSLSLEGRFEEAVNIGLTAVNELGIAMKLKPSKKVLSNRLRRTRKAVMSKSRDDLLSLPKMVDWQALAILQVIEEMSVAVFVSGNEDLQMSNYEIMMSYSLKHGWSPSTMPAAAAFGLVEQGVYGNTKRAAELGCIALDMITRYGAEESKCFVITAVYGNILPLVRPWKECIKAVNEGFSYGIQYGKLYLGLGCFTIIAGYIRLTASLVEAERVIRSNHDTMKRFKVSSSLLPMTTPSWQMIMNLMGCSEDPLKLRGEAMDDADPVFRTSPLAETYVYLMKFELACHFGSLERADHYMRLLEKREEALKPMFHNFVSFKMWSGLTRLGLSCERKQGRRQNLRRAKACLKSLDQIVKNGCEDARPFHMILKAEIASSGGKLDTESYDLAEKTAMEREMVGIAAFACERACFALVNEGKISEEDTRKYWRRTKELYERWEAWAKVEWLNGQHGELHVEHRYKQVPDVVGGFRR